MVLVFLGMTFVGVRAWKKSSDRAGCVMNIYQTQQAVRSLANINGLAPGTNTAALSYPIDIRAQLVGENGYLASEPQCPGDGIYAYAGNVIPPEGQLYLSCSLAESGEHQPSNYHTW